MSLNKEINLLQFLIYIFAQLTGAVFAAITIFLLSRHKITNYSLETASIYGEYFPNPSNPEIITSSDSDAIYEEGCLSVPGQFAEINRPDKCKVKYLDYTGKETILDANGLLATCIQHEIDHLEGILFIDYLSKLKKSMIVKKLSKQKKSLERIVV